MEYVSATESWLQHHSQKIILESFQSHLAPWLYQSFSEWFNNKKSLLQIEENNAPFIKVHSHPSSWTLVLCFGYVDMMDATVQGAGAAVTGGSRTSMSALTPPEPSAQFMLASCLHKMSVPQHGCDNGWLVQACCHCPLRLWTSSSSGRASVAALSVFTNTDNAANLDEYFRNSSLQASFSCPFF